MKIHKMDSQARILIVMASLFVMASAQDAIGAQDTKPFEAGAIRSMVRDHIEANMPWPQGTIRIEFMGKTVDLSLKGEKITYQVQGSPNDDFIGNGSYTIKFFDDGCLLRELTVRVNIEVLWDFVVSTRSLSRDARIGREDVKIASRWISRIPPNAVADPDEAAGRRLSMSIRPQTELMRNMLIKDPVIKKGKMVRVMLDEGSLSIQTIGLSEQDGTVGDIIKVRNVSSKKTIYARVIADSVVQVIF
jgi:flagella basal body P-ring formation protein FlgA